MQIPQKSGGHSEFLSGLPSDVVAGQAVYTRFSLRFYDLIVLKISNRLIWKCPTPRLLEMYDKCVSSNHLEVGVGTGYFLDRCQFPQTADSPEITLLDLNEVALATAAGRIERFSPRTIVANVLEPLPLGDARFDSVGLNYLLHCLPGDLGEKSRAIDHLLPHLNPGAVMFGSTLLTEGTQRSFLARKLMRLYNRKGIFHNEQDSLSDLERELNKRFDCVEIDVAGSAALFRAIC